MSEEIWKDIDGYEGLYQVSNLGRVRSLNRTIIRKNGRVFPFKGKILKQYFMNGYCVVNLYKSKMKIYKVHRLVAQAFIPNPDNLPQVNHKNEVKSCNRVENLEWMSAKDNCNYGTRNKRVSESKMKAIFQYTTQGELVKMWFPMGEVAKCGFNFGHVSECCSNKRKTHKGYIWRYEPMQPLSDTLKDVG